MIPRYLLSRQEVNLQYEVSTVHLTSHDRYSLSALKKQGLSVQMITDHLGFIAVPYIGICNESAATI